MPCRTVAQQEIDTSPSDTYIHHHGLFPKDRVIREIQISGSVLEFTTSIEGWRSCWIFNAFGDTF